MLTGEKRNELLIGALDKHARSEYGRTYNELKARGPNPAQVNEFENLYFIIGGVINEVENLLMKRIKDLEDRQQWLQKELSDATYSLEVKHKKIQALIREANHG